MKILILGGAGFFGANLVRYLIEETNAEITVLDNLGEHSQSSTKSLKEVWNRIHFIHGSITDQKLIDKVVQGQDFIFNLAGQSSHALSMKYPLLDAEANCLGHLCLLEAVRHFNPNATVVYTSSSTVIGKSQEDIIDESHREQPLEIYSANKAAGEKYYRIYHRQHHLKTVILRYANLYGPYGKNDPSFGFVNYFIAQALQDKPLSVYGTGEQIRNVMYVEDACEILWQAANEPELFGEICFATSPFHFSVKDIAEQIVKTFNRGSVAYVDWPESHLRMEVESVVFSSEKLRAITGWQAKYDLQTGLEETLEILNKRCHSEVK